jgi:hypothetical protein
MAIVVSAATIASANFALNRAAPEIVVKLQNILGDLLYKTVTITLSQNRVKAINLLKFMAEFKNEKMIRTVSILIDEVEYEVPIVEIKFTVEEYEFAMKCNVDAIGNIMSVKVSTWKRTGTDIDTIRIKKFDEFLSKVPSTPQPFKPDALAKQINPVSDSPKQPKPYAIMAEIIENQKIVPELAKAQADKRSVRRTGGCEFKDGVLAFYW